MINGLFGQAVIVLPKLVSRAGLLLSTLLLTCIAGVNFITTTHVLEAMGIANACYRLKDRRGKYNTGINAVNSAVEEQTPLLQSSDYEDGKIMH